MKTYMVHFFDGGETLAVKAEAAIQIMAAIQEQYPQEPYRIERVLDDGTLNFVAKVELKDAVTRVTRFPGTN